jgi:hypothetical protein
MAANESNASSHPQPAQRYTAVRRVGGAGMSSSLKKGGFELKPAERVSQSAIVFLLGNQCGQYGRRAGHAHPSLGGKR